MMIPHILRIILLNQLLTYLVSLLVVSTDSEGTKWGCFVVLKNLPMLWYRMNSRLANLTSSCFMICDPSHTVTSRNQNMTCHILPLSNILAAPKCFLLFVTCDVIFVHVIQVPVITKCQNLLTFYLIISLVCFGYVKFDFIHTA